MSKKPFETARIGAKKEAGRSGATNTIPALEHRQPVEEAVVMSRCGYSGDSPQKFKSIFVSDARQPVGFLA